MKILFLGDIVSRVGRNGVVANLPRFREEYGLDLVFANAENLAGGRGVTADTVDEMLDAGVDYMTSGNHVFYTDEWKAVLSDESHRVLRPLNYPEDIVGRGFVELEFADGESARKKLFLVNLISSNVDKIASNPFRAIDKFLLAQGIDGPSGCAVLVDFHAEFTSSKRAMGFYLDGRVSAMIGTHTHVPSADEQVLPGGTGYVTDVGMVGPYNSVLGVKPEIIIDRNKYPYPERFEWVKRGSLQWNSVLLELGENGKMRSVSRLDSVMP